MRSLPFACCAFVLASLGSAGCAHYETVAVGEALTVGDGRVSPALAVEAAMGTGSSRDGGSVFAQTRARGIVGPVRQQIAGFAGVSTLRWISERAPLWLHLDVGPGLEHYSGTLFFEAIAHAKVGSGFVLAQVVEPYAPLNPWGVEAHGAARPVAVDPLDPLALDSALASRHVLRRRVLLTLALGGDVDARFTRDPLYVVSLMVGIAHVEELRRLR